MKALFLLFSMLVLLHAGAQQPLLGRTTGQLPYLEYGPGDDRLGGAKMTYLDTQVLLRVIDSNATDYKVQLSATQIGFIPKTNFRVDSQARLQPYYLTSSWRVWGDDRYDYLSIALPERLPYKVTQQVCPSRLVVDVYGATSNTNWITQLHTAREIRNVWYEQPEHDVFRVFIELHHAQHWGHLAYYRNNVLHVRVKRQPPLKMKGLRVAIDAGHGGANTGAAGTVSNVLEKDYTLKMALQLQNYLERNGAKVFMTRTADVDLGMIERTLMLRQEDPDLLISIHLNSSSNKTVKGTSTYYRYIGFRSLSIAILNRLLKLKLNNFGNIGAFNFALSGPTEYPNCLVEVAFLSNEEDEKRILDERFHKDVAKQIAQGIKDWLKALK